VALLALLTPQVAETVISAQVTPQSLVQRASQAQVAETTAVMRHSHRRDSLSNVGTGFLSAN